MAFQVRIAAQGCCDACLFLSLLTGGIAGCGGSSASKIVDSPANISGNWEFIAQSTDGAIVPMGAALTSSGNVVTGTAVVQKAFPTVCYPNGCCGGPFAEFNGALTGTVDAAGDMTLESAVPNGGPAFTMKGTVRTGLLTNGSFTLTGSCAAQGSMAGTEYPTLNGTYAGTMTSKMSGQSLGLTATLGQSATPNSRGFFNVNATAQLTGYPCLQSAVNATPLDTTSGLLGNSFEVTMTGTPSGTRLELFGTLARDGKMVSAVTIAFSSLGSNCNNDLAYGTLTLQ